jgi:hypothetical protein
MKSYSIFVFLLCVNYKLFSQDFSVFKDKRITSTLNVESNTKPKGEIIQKQNEEVVINPTSSNRMLEREIQIINNEKSTTFLRTITRIKLERSANGRVSIYDSKNPFERDRMADALGIQYDPYIGKTKKRLIIAQPIKIQMILMTPLSEIGMREYPTSMPIQSGADYSKI